MDQTLINWLLGVFGATIGFLLTNIWSAIKDLQVAHLKSVERVNAMEVLVVGDYVRREHLDKAIETLFKKLDKIESIVDRKADRPDHHHKDRAGAD